ncbi:hypothetical protein [Nocardia sp. NRRL S-836]|uniref:hypothetical protein n=1 Tax=Nocardia sp. NRRL S-836 TaxID=1519492 RepID=UPI000B2D9855|nr:hypothetical protein [Nocardia sp. NRRL S-836]
MLGTRTIASNADNVARLKIALNNYPHGNTIECALSSTTSSTSRAVVSQQA